MATPWKWITDYSENSYFEKQKSTNKWYKYSGMRYNGENINFQMEYSLTQLSVDQDDIYPVVYMTRSSDGVVIKLTEGMSYTAGNLTQRENGSGHWEKKS